MGWTIYRNGYEWLQPEALKDELIAASDMNIYSIHPPSGDILHGHIDHVSIFEEQKIIVISDYKPNMNYKFKRDTTYGKHVIKTVPQVSAYALSFIETYKNSIKKGGYTVYCHTYNSHESILYKPHTALESFTNFYEVNRQPIAPKIPPWKWLLDGFKKGGFVGWE